MVTYLLLGDGTTQAILSRVPPHRLEIWEQVARGVESRRCLLSRAVLISARHGSLLEVAVIGRVALADFRLLCIW